MSFLNPVNEPVLRFSSTDAGAPQINYNNRVAGDIKAVLKACLVTGYGATASAGWSIVNEVGHVAEFVSPSAAMSDYRVKVNDSSASSIVWSYLYQDVAESFGSFGSVSKTPSSDVSKTHASNGWDLLITDRGFVFIDKLYVSMVDGITCHYTYISQSKSALSDNANGNNIVFFTYGSLAPTNSFLRDIFDGTGPYYCNIGGFKSLTWLHVASKIIGTYGTAIGLSDIDITGDVYLISSTPAGLNQYNTDLVAQISGLAMQSQSINSQLFDAQEIVVGGRPALSTRSGRTNATSALLYRNSSRGRTIFYLDYWEY